MDGQPSPPAPSSSFATQALTIQVGTVFRILPVIARPFAAALILSKVCRSFERFALSSRRYPKHAAQKTRSRIYVPLRSLVVKFISLLAVDEILDRSVRRELGSNFPFDRSLTATAITASTTKTAGRNIGVVVSTPTHCL